MKENPLKWICVFFLATALASLSSQLQIEIAKSALEAEFKVIAEAIKEAMRMHHFLQEISFFVYGCDKQSSLAITKAI
jgi:hypothetical protein